MVSATLPLPYVVQPSSQWAGIDGNWSTFGIKIGTPPQSFNILPATLNNQIFLPSPELCNSYESALPDCGQSRGVQATSGSEQQGFQDGNSSSWHNLGLYQLASEHNLYPADNGLYGMDNITINGDTANSLPGQVVTEVATPDFWLGSFGLNDQTSNFSVLSNSTPSLLSSMKAMNLTPSLSFAYTAGAAYRSSPGSLILGGYDEAGFEPNQVEFLADASNGTALPMNLQGLMVKNSLEGTMSVPLNGSTFDLGLDSSVSHLWLPGPVCDSLAGALNLTYDPGTGFYLVDSTTHQSLIQAQPTFTFTLAANSSSSTTIDIELPYSAFDLQLSPPIYNTTIPYFPIRRAANESQYVLGRALLQEAYVVVDWERGNFTLAQVAQQNRAKQIVPIDPVEPQKSKTMSPGEKAAISVAVVVAVIIAALGSWLLWRSKRKAQSRAWNGGQDSKEGVEESADDHSDSKEQTTEVSKLQDASPDEEIMSTELLELHEDAVKHQLMSSQIYELDALPSAQELAVAERDEPGPRAADEPSTL